MISRTTRRNSKRMRSLVWLEIISRTTILASSLQSLEVSWVSEIERCEHYHLGFEEESSFVFVLSCIVSKIEEELSLALEWTRWCCGGKESFTVQFTAKWPAPLQHLQERRCRHSKVLWVEWRQWLQLGGDRGCLESITEREPSRGERTTLGLSEVGLCLCLRELTVS